MLGRLGVAAAACHQRVHCIVETRSPPRQLRKQKAAAPACWVDATWRSTRCAYRPATHLMLLPEIGLRWVGPPVVAHDAIVASCHAASLLRLVGLLAGNLAPKAATDRCTQRPQREAHFEVGQCSHAVGLCWALKLARKAGRATALNRVTGQAYTTTLGPNWGGYSHQWGTLHTGSSHAPHIRDESSRGAWWPVIVQDNASAAVAYAQHAENWVGPYIMLA